MTKDKSGNDENGRRAGLVGGRRDFCWAHSQTGKADTVGLRKTCI